MRILWFLPLTLTLALLGLSVYGYARASDSCAFIRNKDLQNFCKAKEQRSVSYCSFIDDRDQENYCKAVVGGNKANCSFIRNRDLQNLCKSEVQ